jgi:hypothetical protein
VKPLTQALDKSFINANLEELNRLNHYVSEKGGFLDCVANNQFKAFSFRNKEEGAARNIFNQYLYHYREFCEIKDSNEKVNKLLLAKPENIIECPIIVAEAGESPETVNNKILEAMNYDLVILRGFLTEHFGLNNELFKIDSFGKYSQEHVDVREQDPNFYGFTKNYVLQKSWKLDDYLNYVRTFDINNKKDKKIYYAVNVDLANYKEMEQELETKVSPLIANCSRYDILAHVRNHIKGMTKPQMYIKVPNVWTGGHEENLRMRSVNMSHGPGNSYWWAALTEDSEKLFNKVQETYGVNIYKKEGVWFPNTEFFLTGDIRVYYTSQKEGDIVVVGPGAIHW